MPYVCVGVARYAVCAGVGMDNEWMVVCCVVDVGWQWWREDWRCSLQAREEGDEAGKDDHKGACSGAYGACYLGGHVVVRALGADAPLLSLRTF